MDGKWLVVVTLLATLGTTTCEANKEPIPGRVTVSPDFVQRFQEAAKRMFEEKLEVMKEVMTKPTDQHHRDKRGIIVTRVQNDHFRFEAVLPFASLGLPYFKDVEIASCDDYLLVSVVTGDTFRDQNKTVVFKIYQNAAVEYLQLIDPEDHSVHRTAIFQDENINLVLAGETTVNIYKYDRDDSQFNQIQTISTSNAFILEQLSIEGVICMLIGSSGSVDNVTSGLNSKLSVYKWEGAHFDQVFEYSVPFLTDICPFEVQGHYFLAVSVLEPDVDIYPDQSFIMRYDLHTEAFVIDHYIYTYGAKDWEFFSISEDKDQENFLVLASNQKDKSGVERSIIYKYIWHKFVPFQCLETCGAKKWQAISVGTDILLILLDGTGIKFYQYDGWRFSEVTYSQSHPILNQPLQSFSAVTLNTTEYLAVASAGMGFPPGSHSIFRVDFQLANEVDSFHETLEAVCEENRDSLTELMDRISNITKQLPNLVYINLNETQELTGNITFAEEVVADEVDVKGNASAKHGHIFNATEAEQFERMKERADRQTNGIDWLEERLNNTMKTIGVQTVTAAKSFEDLSSTSMIDATSVAVTSDLLNKFVNLTDLDENIFRKDKSMTVKVPVTINGSLLLGEDLRVEGLIDGILTDDIVTLTGNHTIAQPKMFSQPTKFRGDLNVTGLIDGVNLGVDDVLLTSRNQTVEGNLTFSKTVRFGDDVRVDGAVNGTDISDLEETSVFKNKTHFIEGIKIFKANVTSLEGLSLASGKMIDTVSVEEMDENILKISFEQNVTGNYTFSDNLQIRANLSVEGPVNDLDIPDDILLVESSELFTINGPITFTEDLNVSNITVETSIDQVAALSGGSSLALLLLSSLTDQVVTGNIKFKDDLVLEKDTDCEGLVDGIDLSELALEAVREDEDANITGTKILEGPLEFSGDVVVGRLISSVNLTTLDEGALKISDDVWKPNATLVLSAQKTKFAANLETYDRHSFTGIRLSDLSLQGQKETINGEKMFQAVHSDSDVNITGKVNNVSIVRLCIDSVFLNSTGLVDIFGDIVFEKSLSVSGDLSLNGTLDGAYLDDFVTLHSVQNISLNTDFYSNIEVDELTVDGNINVTEKVNEEDVSELYQDTLFTAVKQNVTGHKMFLEDVILETNLNISGSVNDVDISELADDAVFKAGDYTISEKKVFASKLSVQKMEVGGLVNGGNLSQFVEDIVLQNEEQEIFGNLTFSKTLNLNSSLDTEGNINGLNLTEFNSSVHKLTDDEFTGELSFGDIFSNGSIRIDGLVNGVDIGNGTVARNVEDQVVVGEKTFTSNVTVDGHLICPKINNLDIVELDASVFKTVENQNITEAYTFWDGITWLSNATVGGLVDGVDLTDLASNIWKEENPEGIVVNVTGNGTFNILESGDIFYNGTLDGVDLQELNRTYVSLTSSQTITESKHFLDKVIVDESSNLRSEYLDVEGTVKGLNLTDISSRAFISGMSGQEVEGELKFTENVTFQDDVDVDGTVDGVSISDNVMFTHRTNILKAHKNFSDGELEISSSLFMKDGKTVQGVDVSEMKLRSADRINNYVISEDTAFVNITMLSGLTLEGLLNGVNYSTEYVLTIPHDQTVFGNITFQTTTIFYGDMTTTTVNGLDMVDLATNTLFTTGDQTVTGNITLASVNSFQNVTTFGLLGGVRVPQLYQSLFYYPDLDSFNDTLIQQCEVLDELHLTQQNEALLFRGLTQLEVIETVGNVVWYPYEEDGEFWVILAVSPVYDWFRGAVEPDECSTVSVRKWENRQYQEELFMTFDLVGDVKYFRNSLIMGYAVAERFIDGACLNISDFRENITSLPDVNPSAEHPDDDWLHVIYVDWNNGTYHQRLYATGPVAIEIIKEDGNDEDLCIFVGSKYDDELFDTEGESNMYCYNSSWHRFVAADSLQTFGVVEAKYFASNDTSYLVVGNRVDPAARSHEVDSFLVRVDLHGDGKGRVNLQETFPTRAASSVTAGEVKGQMLLVFVNEFTGTWMFEDYEQTVDIYRFMPEGIELFQKIDAFGAKAATFFSVADMDFLAIINRNEELLLYKYEGILLFEKYYTLHVPGATDVATQALSDNVVHIFVATYSGSIKLFPWESSRPLPSPTQILEVVLSGFSLESTGCSSHYW